MKRIYYLLSILILTFIYVLLFNTKESYLSSNNSSTYTFVTSQENKPQFSRMDEDVTLLNFENAKSNNIYSTFISKEANKIYIKNLKSNLVCSLFLLNNNDLSFKYLDWLDNNDMLIIIGSKNDPSNRGSLYVLNIDTLGTSFLQSNVVTFHKFSDSKGKFKLQITQLFFDPTDKEPIMDKKIIDCDTILPE